MSSTASESDVIATLSADRRHSSLRRIGRVLRAASQAEPGKKSGMTQLASWGLGRSAHTPLASGIGSGPIVLDETAIGVRCLWWPAALGSLQDRRPGSEIRSEIAPYSGLGFAARDAWPWTRIRRWPLSAVGGIPPRLVRPVDVLPVLNLRPGSLAEGAGKSEKPLAASSII